MSVEAFFPQMMTVEQFAKHHAVSETTVRECIKGVSRNYPPLRVKQVGSGPGKRIYITAEQAAEWRDALPDA